MIAIDGWSANPELIPADLIVRRYFSAEQKEIETLSAEQEALTAQMEELNEEHANEEGLLADAMNDKGKITKASLKAFIKAIADDDDVETQNLASGSETQNVETQNLASLPTHYLNLIDEAAEAGRKVNDAQKKLDEKVAAKYAQLSVDEIKALVIDDKWFATLAANIEALVQAIATQFATRVKELAERYALPLPHLTSDVETLMDKVNTHLKKMGFSWK